MQSIFGALLTAGYASAFTQLIADSPDTDSISDSTQAALTKSFSSATNLAGDYPPQTAESIVAAAQSSFIDGQDWAYVAGLIAVGLGGLLVFFMFPTKQREDQLLTEYRTQDTAAREAQPVLRSDSIRSIPNRNGH
jgi:hypothetical protein